MPRTEEECKEVSNGFNSRWNFPNCLGSTDRKRAQILAPKNSSRLFSNYKGTSNAVFFAVVDVNYNVTHADVGCQWRLSDGGVFTHTTVYTKLEKNQL
jgi:hypothetical protein